MADPVSLLPQLIDIAKQSGQATVEYFNQDQKLQVRHKGDNTPLTAADLAANEAVVAGLLALNSDIPIVSEENEIVSFDQRKQWSRYWLVDPLDGTRGFIEGCKEYTVNIALVENHQVIAGVVYAPMLDLCYYAARGFGAYKQEGSISPYKINTTKIDWPGLRIVLGRYIRKTKLLQMYEAESSCQLVRINSSLKFCLIAEGKADLYPRLGETGEWDTAAGQCILQEAGGALLEFSGEELRYNLKPSVINPPFVAFGDPSVSHRVIEFIEEKRRQL